MAQYGTIITNIGLAQIANAQITQTKVGLEYIALGDGNGAHYVPKQNQTALVHEVWRGPIAELSIDPTNSNRIIIDAVIPVTAGGFTIREIGIFDDKNNLIAVGQYPEKYKPQLSEGVSEETLIHFVIETNNADVVKLTIDPTVIIASRNYVDGKVAQVQTALTEHSAQTASPTKLGHIMPDGETIIVDPVTGFAKAKASFGLTEANGDLKDFSGRDANTLIESGFYTITGTGHTNFPMPNLSTQFALIEVMVSENGNTIFQRFTYSTTTYKRVFSTALGNKWSDWIKTSDPTGSMLTYVTVPFENGWTGSGRVRKTLAGNIEVDFSVTTPPTIVNTAVIATLPMEMRPGKLSILPLLRSSDGNFTGHWVYCQANGTIRLVNGTPNPSANTGYSFNGIFF